MSTKGIENRKRICLISMRTQNTHVSRCSDYEFEDVILSVDDADLLTIEQGITFSLRKRLINQSTRHISAYFSRLSPSFSRLSLKKEYDLFIAIFEDITDVLVVNSHKGVGWLPGLLAISHRSSKLIMHTADPNF